MQALDRIVISHNWITILFVFAMFLLFMLKKIDQTKLIGYATSFFITGFIEEKIEEKQSFFSFFNLLLFLFTLLIVSLSFLLLLSRFSPEYTIDFSFFIKLVGFVALYFLVFLRVDLLLTAVFQIKKELNCFMAAKMSYLHTISLWLFPVLIATVYGLKNTTILAGSVIALLFLRIALVFVNNKNLIVNKLFYFILYLCALEIAPLLIFYKTAI